MQTNKDRGVQQRSSRRTEGYTLLEILCAVVISAIAAAALFVGFDSGFGLLRTTREDLRATQILIQKTEAVRLLSWNQLTNSTGTFSFQEYYYPPGSVTNSAGTLYSGNFYVSNAPTYITNSYKADLRLITVTLSWNNYLGSNFVAHSRSMQTFSAKRGLRNYVYGSGNTN